MEENKVLAKVNGKEITEKTVEEFMRSLPQQMAMQVRRDGNKKAVINEIINSELIYADAIDNRYDEEDEFLERLDKEEERLLKQYAIFKLYKTFPPVEDDEVETYYKENKMNFFADEEVRASHILVKEEGTAKKVIEELNSGVDFEQAAKTYSTCPSKQRGGDLGFFGKGKMVKEFEDAAFAMEKGKVSEPVKTQFGYHIIKVTDKKEAGILSFEEIKENLKRELTKAKQSFYYNQKINQLKNTYKVEIFEEEKKEEEPKAE